MTDGKRVFLDGFAATVGEDPFTTVNPQPHPTSPRIKHLLGRALLSPESLEPREVQEMAASLVYNLLSRARL